jgi:hypothetical protein
MPVKNIRHMNRERKGRNTMIHDVLADAMQRMDFYLNRSRSKETYKDQRTRILQVMQTMEALRRELDAPPQGEE